MERDNSPTARWEIENVKSHLRSQRKFHATHGTSKSITRSPGLAEYDLRRIHGFGNGSCSHVHDHPGIARFLAKLMVGDMY